MKNFLKQNHTVKMIDGVEVEKPTMEYIRANYGTETPWDLLLHQLTEQYNNATEAIRLPNWMEFWDLLGKADYFDSDHVSIMDEYWSVAEHMPTLSQFVPVGKNGEVLEEPNKEDYIFEDHPELVGSPKEYDMEFFNYDLKQYQAAQEKVIFEGWEVSELNKFIIEIQDRNKNILRFDIRSNLCYLINPRFKQIKTTDDLNRETQLYLKP